MRSGCVKRVILSLLPMGLLAGCAVPAETAAPQGRFFLKRLKRGLSFALKLLVPGALKRMKFIL